MKIPINFKLPRKLKKELKKGFTRNIKSGAPEIKESPTGICTSMFMAVSYSGINTKSFRRLCRFARKIEVIEMDYFKRTCLLMNDTSAMFLSINK